MAERSGADRRRLLRSAERLSEAAIARAPFLNTDASRSSALLVSVTSFDHFFERAGRRADVLERLGFARLVRRDAFVERFIVVMAMPEHLHDGCHPTSDRRFGRRPSRRFEPSTPHRVALGP